MSACNSRSEDGGELTSLIQKTRQELDVHSMISHSNEPYLQEAICFGYSQEKEGLLSGNLS